MGARGRRYSVAQHIVHVPAGLVNGSLVAAADSTLLAFHASRTAVRLYKGLLPLAYEHWDSNEEDEQRWALSEASRRRLARLLECLATDFGALRRNSSVSLRGVVADVREVTYPLLSQTTAVALAYAAFKVTHAFAFFFFFRHPGVL